MLHAFRENLLSIGITKSLDEIKQALREEMKRSIYQEMDGDTDIKQDLEAYLASPLSNYLKDTTDLYLDALAMCFKVNTIVFQSDIHTCEIIDNINPDNNFAHTIYFVRTESPHVDAVVPAEPIVFEVASGDESDDCYVTEVSSGIDLSGCQTGVSNNSSPILNYENPSAELLLKTLLIDPSQQAVSAPLKRCRENRLFTVKDCTLVDINCDDNGKYHGYNKNSKRFYVEWVDGEIKVVKYVHTDKSDGRHYYKERISRAYKDVYVAEEDTYVIVRHWRYCSSIPGLKQVVAEVVQDGYQHPYFCVVYSMSGDKSDDVDVDVNKISCLPYHSENHGDSFAKPYIRSHPAVLSRMDELVENEKSSSVFHTVLQEAGGPIFSDTPSMEPRSVHQVTQRKSMINKRKRVDPESPPVPVHDLDKLLAMQRNPDSPVRTVLIFRDSYVAFIYSEKQLLDLEMFCCDPRHDTSVLGIDTTFNLCKMWVTDTCYRNQRLVSRRTKKHPVHLGPVMLHFSKDTETFRRFCLELISANPAISNLRKVGVDMEAAIFNGFRSAIGSLMQLYCVRHLQQRDIKAIDNLFKKSKLSDKTKNGYKNEILWDIYGRRTSEVLEKGLAEAVNEEVFNAKLESLKPRWSKLCPGFFTSVIQSSREGTCVDGLYYQNDIESLHAVQKRIQQFSKGGGDIFEAVSVVKKMMDWEEDEERLALYSGSGNYVLSPTHKEWFAPAWHSWNADKREAHIHNFRKAAFSQDLTFVKPVGAGRKPGNVPRLRLSRPSDVTERIVLTTTTATTPSFVTAMVSNVRPVIATAGTHTSSNSSANTTTTTSSSIATTSTSNARPVAKAARSKSTRTSSNSSANTTTATSSSTATTSTLNATAGTSSQTSSNSSTTTTTSSVNPVTASLSFEDPRVAKNSGLELHLKAELKGGKNIKKCRGNCGGTMAGITLVVRTYGNRTYLDPTSRVPVTTFGPLFIHFNENCLKDYDTHYLNIYYAPHESYDYSRIKLDPASKVLITKDDLDFLEHDLGVTITA